MARIDGFIMQMAAQQAEALFIESGNTIFLSKNGAKHPIINVRRGELQNEHVRMLVADIAPASEKTAVEHGMSASFPYHTPTGPVFVQFIVYEGRAMARIVPMAEENSVAAPASASMMSAQSMQISTQQPAPQAVSANNIRPAVVPPIAGRPIANRTSTAVAPTSTENHDRRASDQPVVRKLGAGEYLRDEQSYADAPPVSANFFGSVTDFSALQDLGDLERAIDNVMDEHQAQVPAHGSGPVSAIPVVHTYEEQQPEQVFTQTRPAYVARTEEKTPQSMDSVIEYHAPKSVANDNKDNQNNDVADAKREQTQQKNSVYTKKLEQLFRFFVEKGASDLHLTAGKTPMMRLDGDMVPFQDFGVPSVQDIENMIRSIMPVRNVEEFDKTNDTDFAYEIDVARIRANVFRDRFGVGGVFRKIPSKVLSASQLNLPSSVINFCSLKKGLVVVTGPTGSGKSTTLAAMIDWINTNRADHIITIEDPVEFVHEPKKALINQRQIGVHTQSFSRALRAALREDPDIVLVGEMRDLETVAIAIETAETGHLVFGTLHTNTAPSTVDRIIDQFPTDRQEQVRLMLSESLKGVVAQILCKKKGGGRVAALEILICTTAITNLIREHKTFQIPSVMQTNRGLGMRTLNDSLLEHIKNNNIEPAEAYGKAVDKMGLLGQMRNLGINVSFLESEKENRAA